MRHLLLATAAVLAVAVPAHAQGTTPKWEVFGGYSFVRELDESDAEAFFENQLDNLHGFGFSFASNVWKSIAVVADVSYHRKEIDALGSDLKVAGWTFLFGPRFCAHRDQMTFFGHALVGAQRAAVEVTVLGVGVDDSETGFALGFGGGLDINVGDRIAIRAAQFDYIPNRFEGKWSNSLRYEAGVVVKFGEP